MTAHGRERRHWVDWGGIVLPTLPDSVLATNFQIRIYLNGNKGRPGMKLATSLH